MAGQPRHYYRRTDWRCIACGEEWPCATRRADFLDKFAAEKPRLRSILGTLALDAERDFPSLTREELYARFISWTYDPSERPAGPPPRASLRHPGFKS